MDHPQKPEPKKAKPRNPGLDWLLWWQIDQDELKKQVAGYSTMKITESIRGISLLLILLSTLFTVISVFYLGVDQSAFIDAGVFLILGICIYRGYRWAMIVAMLFWTFEKIFLLGTASEESLSSILVMTIIWWTVFMHAFYLSFCVEQARHKARKHSQTI